VVELVLTGSEAAFARKSFARTGRLAQLVRAPALHAGGHRFESYTAQILLGEWVWASWSGAVLSSAIIVISIGVVVQLVRTHACHA
jgi:hypothetical protein